MEFTEKTTTLAFETFKALKNLNPNFMKDTFNFSLYSTDRKHDIFLHNRNTSNYGDRSLRARGPHSWNPPLLQLYLKILSKIGSGLNVNVSCASRQSHCIQNDH